MMTLFNRQFRIILLLLFLVEELSFLGYLLPSTNGIIFWLLSAVALTLAIWRLEWAIGLVLVELMIGSKGYLFFADIFGTKISIRIALWSIVMLVWFGKTLISMMREKNLGIEIKNFFFSLKTGEKRSLALLALFVCWGLINGLLISRNDITNTFLDFNGWLFFLLIFPLTAVLRKREDFEKLLPLLLAAAIWLALKTFFLAFIFSHASMDSAAFRLYRWVRVSGVGEITQIKGGFYRIFLQSQIYLIIAYLAGFWIIADRAVKVRFREIWNDIDAGKSGIVLIISLSVALLSLSRSFWLGLAAGMIFLFVILAAQSGFLAVLKRLPILAVIWSVNIVLSVLLVAGLASFPIPPSLGGFNTGSLISSRISDDAASVSRWRLLPKIWQEIKTAPILGQGFGATVTYQSQDPRQLELPTKGAYTTYAFEWGWLDIWLKLGVFGVAAYLWLIGSLLRRIFRHDSPGQMESRLNPILGIGLVAIAVIHFFSPYLNHPLGIGYIIFLFSISQITANNEF